MRQVKAQPRRTYPSVTIGVPFGVTLAARTDTNVDHHSLAKRFSRKRYYYY